MTVGSLINKLSSMDPNKEVVAEVDSTVYESVDVEEGERVTITASP